MSLSFKVAEVFQNSRFDGENRFTMAVNKKNPQIISFSPSDKSIFMLNLNEPQDRNLGRLLTVPIDSHITWDLEFRKESIGSQFFQLLLSLRDKDTNLTAIDVLRLSLFARSVPSESISEETLASYNLSDIQEAISFNFIDSKMVSEKLRIEVINGTEVAGLANRLAAYISNMGGNVILISTSDKVSKESEIKYFGERRYTVSKLKGLLGFKDVKGEKKNISDVIITIGEDRVDSLPF